MRLRQAVSQGMRDEEPCELEVAGWMGSDIRTGRGELLQTDKEGMKRRKSLGAVRKAQIPRIHKVGLTDTVAQKILIFHIRNWIPDCSTKQHFYAIELACFSNLCVRLPDICSTFLHTKRVVQSYPCDCMT